MPKTLKAKGKVVGAKQVGGKKKISNPTPGKVEQASLIDKVTGRILMISPRGDGTIILINGESYEFLIKLDNPNYAAMVSTALAAQAAGHDMAVKYRRIYVGQNNERSVVSVAKGVHAVISGASY